MLNLNTTIIKQIENSRSIRITHFYKQCYKLIIKDNIEQTIKCCYIAIKILSQLKTVIKHFKIVYNRRK